MKMIFIALLSDAGQFFPLKSSQNGGFWRKGGGEKKKKKQIPLYPATCVLIFRVECCCLLALQERERVLKNTVEVCILRMCIIFQRRTSYTKKKKKRVKKKKETGGKGILL